MSEDICTELKLAELPFLCNQLTFDSRSESCRLLLNRQFPLYKQSRMCAQQESKKHIANIITSEILQDLKTNYFLEKKVRVTYPHIFCTACLTLIHTDIYEAPYSEYPLCWHEGTPYCLALDCHYSICPIVSCVMFYVV